MLLLENFLSFKLQEIENHYASSIDTFDFEFFNTFNSQNVTNMISSFQEFNLNITLKLQEAVSYS